jgi:osmotically-inducible protein OsmY
MSDQKLPFEFAPTEILEFYEWKKKTLREKYEADIADIDRKIKALSNGNTGFTTVNGGSGWKGKIAKAIQTSGKPMRSADIVNEIMKVDDYARNNRDSAFKSITSTLSTNSRPGGMFKKEIVNGYGLYSMA